MSALPWRKSSYSSGNGDACIEVAAASTVLVRDTTNRDGGTLNVSPSAWLKFVSEVRAI